MKKAYFIIPLLVVIFSSSVLFGTARKARVEKEILEKQVLSAQNEAKKSITYIINFGDNKIETTLPFEENQTILQTLEKIAQEKNIILDPVKSNYGTYINGIGEYKGTKQKAWLFYVNGKAADKGADSTLINPGDTIEWRYQSF